MSKGYYVYIIKNIILDKSYIGSRMNYIGDPNEDTYMGSSKYLNKDYDIYGLENFQKEILEFYENKKDLIDGESEYIIKLNTLHPNGYNKNIPNQHLKFHRGGIPISDEAKKKISIGLKKAYREKRKIVPDYSGTNHPMFGKNHREESKKKIGQAQIGKKISEETKKKMSNSSIGIKKTQEHRKNISKGRIGIIFSEEHKKNISKSHKGIINKISIEGREILSKTISEVNNRRIKCIYCDRSFNPGNYGRYHGEKCKNKC